MSKHTKGPFAEKISSLRAEYETQVANSRVPGNPFQSGLNGRIHGMQEVLNHPLYAAAPELYDMLDKINAAFYTRTSRKHWLALMEQTKPLLQKARGESC